MYQVFVLGHLLGVAIGAGGAFVGDALFLRSARDRILSEDEIKLLNTAGGVTWLGLSLLILTGLGLFFLNAPELLSSVKFLTKMIVVAVIFVNGIVFHAYHIPHMKRHTGMNLATSPTFKKRSRLMLLSGSISVTSWLTAIFLGGLASVPFTLWQSICLYLMVLVVASAIAQLLRPLILGIRE